MQNILRHIPSVDACLAALKTAQASGLPAIPDFAPPALITKKVRDFLDLKRAQARSGSIDSAESLRLDSMLPELIAFVLTGLLPDLRRVINATGVVIHTNLGRSILAEEAVCAVHTVAGNYCNLEFDLKTGERGSRQHLVRDLLCMLTGAESAIVVNNNAAAVFLALNTLCARREVVVSRGQLVEIGGSFRIPEVMSLSGALLHEVGATNRTHLADYQKAIGPDCAALLRVHTSNYRIVGFQADVSSTDLAQLAATNKILVIEDLGSGSLLDFSPWGLRNEPTVQDSVKSGIDIVTFSGDKVLGGPQAGIILGKAELIRQIADNQLLRAMRCDKFTLAALEATLRLYLDPQKALKRVPTLRMMTMPFEQINKQARRLQRKLKQAVPAEYATLFLQKDISRVGGGSFPEQALPTMLVAVKPRNISAQDLRQRLLQAETPIISRLADDVLLLDPRTLVERNFLEIPKIIANALLLYEV